jgi:hypothetical protein
MVCPDYCTVDHLQAGVAAPAVVAGFQHQFPQAGQRPPPKLTIDRRPFAKMLVQIAPRNARPRNPENPIENKPVVPRATAASGAALDNERLKARPSLVAHQTPYQNDLRKSHVESELGPVGNPLCQRLRGTGLIDKGPKTTVAEIKVWAQ